MYLTMADLLERLDTSDFKSVDSIKSAVYSKLACGISDNTAKQIHSDYIILSAYK